MQKYIKQTQSTCQQITSLRHACSSIQALQENQRVMQIGTGTRAESTKICKNMAGYGMTDNLYIQYKI
jgi:hypothetical protein